jgi:hypothetical protein
MADARNPPMVLNEPAQPDEPGLFRPAPTPGAASGRVAHSSLPLA